MVPIIRLLKKKTEYKCVQNQEIPLCYPSTWILSESGWILSESGGTINIQSVKSENPPFFIEIIGIKTRELSFGSNGDIKEETHNAVAGSSMPDARSLFWGSLAQTNEIYNFEKPARSKRGFGQAIVKYGDQGQFTLILSPTGDAGALYLRAKIVILFHTRGGFLSVMCELFSEQKISLSKEQISIEIL